MFFYVHICKMLNIYGSTVSKGSRYLSSVNVLELLTWGASGQMYLCGKIMFYIRRQRLRFLSLNWNLPEGSIQTLNIQGGWHENWRKAGYCGFCSLQPFLSWFWFFIIVNGLTKHGFNANNRRRTILKISKLKKGIKIKCFITAEFVFFDIIHKYLLFLFTTAFSVK